MSEQAEKSEAAGVNTTELVAEIVCAYVSKNTVDRGELPGLISAVHGALTKLGQPAEPVVEQRAPAVSVRKSITPEYLVSLEDGRHYKALKRHLTGLGLTPAEYRAKWGLPADYPMVAPNYAAMRSELAKSLGLGQQRRKAVSAPETVVAPAKPRGRPRKAA